MTVFGFDLDAQPIPPPALIVNRHVLLMDDRFDHAMSHRPPADLSLKCRHATGPLSPVTRCYCHIIIDMAVAAGVWKKPVRSHPQPVQQPLPDIPYF